VRSVEFHPEAEAELVSAAQYFESHVEHLGLDARQKRQGCAREK
jgi:hypothetical protein